MGDGPAAVQETGLGEGEGTAAERRERSAPGVGVAQGVEHRSGCGCQVVVESWDHDQVRAGQPGKGPVGGERQAAPELDGGRVARHAP